MATKTEMQAEIDGLKNMLEAALAVTETDNTFYAGKTLSGLYRDRYDYDRQTIFAECLRAWRVNPIARRIVKLITPFAVGLEPITLEVRHKATQKFINEWENHPLNFLDRTTQKEWSDELYRSGNLFYLFSVVDRMPFIRATPADLIRDIQTVPNDYKQETYYIPTKLDQQPWTAWTPDWEPTESENAAMIHFAANRPVGVAWGEPDMAPLLDWIGHFSAWLRDRARLNRFRNVFNYIVVGDYKNEEDRKARERELNQNPPTPGSILVINKNTEAWGVLAPNLDAFDASTDGLALKKMVSAGTGFPLHYFAEPESSTRTTAEAAGTPTFRNLGDFQADLFSAYIRTARVAIILAKQAGWSRLDPAAKIIPHGADITERDNSVLALAVNRIYPTLADLFDRNGIDEAEMLRLIYRMAGEVYDKGESAVHMLRKPLTTAPDVQPPSDSENDPNAVPEVSSQEAA